MLTLRQNPLILEKQDRPGSNMTAYDLMYKLLMYYEWFRSKVICLQTFKIYINRITVRV